MEVWILKQGVTPIGEKVKENCIKLDLTPEWRPEDTHPYNWDYRFTDGFEFAIESILSLLEVSHDDTE